MKSKIITLMFLIAVACGGLLYLNSQRDAPYAAVDHIISYITPSGELLDFHNEIGVHSPKDVGWSYDEKKDIFYVEYGKIEIEITRELLYDTTMLSKLAKVGVVPYSDRSTGDIFFKYKGQVMEQWVRR